MSNISHFVIAFEERAQLGECVEVAGARGTIVAELTRDQFVAEVRTTVLPARYHRAGSYDPVTKEFKPATEVPAEMRFFYRCEPL